MQQAAHEANTDSGDPKYNGSVLNIDVVEHDPTRNRGAQCPKDHDHNESTGFLHIDHLESVTNFHMGTQRSRLASWQ